MPAGETFRMEVLLEVYVTVVLRLVPEVVWTDVVKTSVAPASRDVVVLGVRATFPAKRGGPALAPPPQAAMPSSAETATINQGPREQNLPMHSSLGYRALTVMRWDVFRDMRMNRETSYSKELENL